MTSKVEIFLSNPTQEQLDSFKKDELIQLARKYDLSEAKASLTKQEIKAMLIQYLVEKNVFDPSVLAAVSKSTSDSDIKVKELELKFKMELELRKLELQKEERQMQMQLQKEERQMQMQLEIQKEQMKNEEREKDRQMELQKQQMHIELQKEQMKIHLQEKEIELASEKNIHHSNLSFDIAKNIRLVPPFREREVDKYFIRFETIADNLKWPREHWTQLLQCVLTGKASDIYSSLSRDVNGDYDVVKECILKGYELVPEAYRQKFRNYKKESGQTHIEFAREKELLFDRWCLAMKVEQDYQNLKQIILIEEFKNCIHSDVKSYLNDHKIESLEKAAQAADEYFVNHKISCVNKTSTHQSSDRKVFQHKISPSKTQTSTTFKNQTSEKFDSRSLSLPTCAYCRKKGHVISDCYKLKNRNQNQTRPIPNALISKRSRSRSSIGNNTFIGSNKPRSDFIMENYEPFISKGSISLLGDLANPTPIRILRDTGASQSLLLSGTLPLSEKSSNESVLIQGVECGFVNVPLHCVNLTSDLVSGPVTVGMVSDLPVEGIHLLLGNDLAGDKVVVNPLVTDKPCLDQKVDSIESEFPEIFTACAVTRAMAKKALENEVDEGSIPLADTCIGQAFDEVTFTSCLDQSEGIDHSDPLLTTHSLYSNQVDKRQSLVVEQEKDPEISCLFQRAISETEAMEVPVCYFIKNGILMRKWRPPEVPAGDEWSVNYQIVVPKPYRQEILSLAHETPLAGHLGTHKTYHKILTHFYWPKIKSDVAKYCRSCHTCQLVGKEFSPW